MKHFTPSYRLTLLTLAVCALTQVASASLVWETREVRLKASPYDKEVTASFPYTNDGKEAVTIKSLRSTCGCVVPKVENMVIPPGGKGEITAVFTLEHRIGTHKRPITVEFADPKVPKLGLYLYVEIPKVIRSKASFLRWGPGEPLEPKTLTVEIDEQFPVESLAAKSKHPNLEIKVTPTGPSRTYTVEVQPHPVKGSIATVLNLEATLVGSGLKRSDVLVFAPQTAEAAAAGLGVASNAGKSTSEANDE